MQQFPKSNATGLQFGEHQFADITALVARDVRAPRLTRISRRFCRPAL
jgi:hypothetical protein